MTGGDWPVSSASMLEMIDLIPEAARVWRLVPQAGGPRPQQGLAAYTGAMIRLFSVEAVRKGRLLLSIPDTDE